MKFIELIPGEWLNIETITSIEQKNTHIVIFAGGYRYKLKMTPHVFLNLIGASKILNETIQIAKGNGNA